MGARRKVRALSALYDELDRVMDGDTFAVTVNGGNGRKAER